MTTLQKHPMNSPVSGERVKSKELDRLLKEARDHVMTPAEIWDQRISFTYGQLMDCAPEITQEQVERQAEAIYGPRPSDDTIQS